MVTWYIANHNKGFPNNDNALEFWHFESWPWVRGILPLSDLPPVRYWQRVWSTTRPWQTWIWISTTWVMLGLRLGVWWGWWGSWGIDHEGGRCCSRDPDRASRRWNGELSERKTTQRIGVEMCHVHDADLSEFELVLFFSFETTWYVSMSGSMRRMR